MAVVANLIAIGVTQHAKIGGAEGLQPQGGSLGHLAGALNFVIQHDQYAHAARLRRCRNPHGIVEVQGRIGALCACGTLGADDDDRLGAFQSQIEEVGRLFGGCGAMSDDDAVQRRVSGHRVMHRANQLQPVGRTDFRRPDRLVRNQRQVRGFADHREFLDDLPDRHLLAAMGVVQQVQRAEADRRNSAASTDDCDFRHSLCASAS